MNHKPTLTNRDTEKYVSLSSENEPQTNTNSSATVTY